jgi:hypothetical protein
LHYTGRFDDQSGRIPGLAAANDARWWNNVPSGLVIRTIENPGRSMTFTLGSVPPSRPTIAIRSVGPVTEGRGNGLFRIERNGSLAERLMIPVRLSGSAVRNLDFTTTLNIPAGATSGVIEIPAGQAYATIVVSPIDDTVQEPTEQITATLEPGNYLIGLDRSATLVLNDDDRLLQAFLNMRRAFGDGRINSSGYDPQTDTWTLVGSGSGISGMADNGIAALTPVTGDFILTVRVLPEAFPHTWSDLTAKYGLIVRDPAGNKLSFLHWRPAWPTWPGFGIIERTTTDGTAIDLPVAVGSSPFGFTFWLRITRKGSSLTHAYSSNGVIWHTIGIRTIALPQLVTVGLFLQGGSPELPAYAKFDALSLVQVSSN